jgi:hypothetical protein
MKQKLRDRLDRIEEALRELTKEVRALRPTGARVSHGDDDNEERDPTTLDKPKEVVQAVKAALGKTRKRSSP